MFALEKRSALLKEVWFQVKKYSKSFFGGKNLWSLRMDLSHQKKDYALTYYQPSV